MHVSRLLAGIVLVVALPSVAQAQFWCWDADEVIAEVEGVNAGPIVRRGSVQ